MIELEIHFTISKFAKQGGFLQTLEKLISLFPPNDEITLLVLVVAKYSNPICKSESRNAQIPGFSKKSGILSLTND
ncbi:MAG: hypothetical protein C4323_22945 [Mastigocladus sp. ERB_26_2]